MTKRNRDAEDDFTSSFFGGGGDGESNIAPTEDSISMRLRQFWPFFRPCRPGELRDSKEIEAKVCRHHGPHNDAKIEWWYVNGHLGGEAGGALSDFSFFAAFFRLVGDSVDPGEKDRTYVHALNWAIIDKKNNDQVVASGQATTAPTGQPSTTSAKGYYPFSTMDPISPSVCLDMIRSNIYHGNPQLIQSLTEMLQDNQVPLPDTLMESAAEVSDNKLVFGESSFEIIPTERPADAHRDDPTPSPSFKLVLSGQQPPVKAGEPSQGKLKIELILKPNQGPCLHGKDGVVSLGSKVDDMFYYFYPSCDVNNFKVLQCDDVFPFQSRLNEFAAKAAAMGEGQSVGRGWVDHEFGGAIPGNMKEFEFIFNETINKRSGMEHAWEWAAILLDSGMKLSVTSLINPAEMSNESKGVVERFAVVLHPDGRFERVDKENVSFAPTAHWKSPVTTSIFPVAWSVQLTLSGGAKLNFTIDAGNIRDQELITLAAKPSFWEGYANVKGTFTPADSAEAKSISGEAILECHGETDLNAVGSSVEQLHNVLFAPLAMTVPKDASVTAETPITPAFLEGVAMKVRPNIEMAATMLKAMAPDQPEMTAEQKEVLAHVGAVFVASAHHGATHVKTQDDFETIFNSYLDKVWEKQCAKMLPDFKRLLLRTFVLREVEECRKNCPALASAQSGADGDDAPAPAPVDKSLDGAKILANLTKAYTLPADQLYAIPSAQELKASAKVKDVAVAQHLFSGSWIKDWDRSQKLSDLLSSQGVGIIVRKLTDSLTPKMVTTVHPRFFKSQVTTSVSNILAQDHIDGTEYKWDSSGRGEIKSRSCLVQGGQVLYTQSILPASCQKLKDEASGEPLMEHKWLHQAEDGAMIQRTLYGPHAIDCYFKKDE